MQNVAIMLIDNYSYLRLLFYIRNVNICFYSVVVNYTIKALPHIIYTISFCVLFCLVILC